MMSLRQRVASLGLVGVVERFEEFESAPWLERLVAVEEAERGRRRLASRLRSAKLGRYKALCDFDWSWPEQLDRDHLEQLFGLGFLDEGANIVLMGPNGVGKTMLLKNLGYRCLESGHTVRFVTASGMLNALAAEDSASGLERRIRRLCSPKVLLIDEVGYLSYGNRHADLLYEVINRRYEMHKPVAVTTNKAFGEWGEVFPNAACVVTLVDRLIHRCEVVHIRGASYRLKEAKERSARRQTKS